MHTDASAPCDSSSTRYRAMAEIWEGGKGTCLPPIFFFSHINWNFYNFNRLAQNFDHMKGHFESVFAPPPVKSSVHPWYWVAWTQPKAISYRVAGKTKPSYAGIRIRIREQLLDSKDQDLYLNIFLPWTLECFFSEKNLILSDWRKCTSKVLQHSSNLSSSLDAILNISKLRKNCTDLIASHCSKC